MLCGSNDIDDSDDDDQFMVMGPFILNHIVGSRFRGAGFGSVSLELGLRFERATLLRACSFRVPGQENWKLVLKVGKTSKLGFSSPLWTNSELLNKDSAEDKAEDAKYDAFNAVPFKKIRMCVDEPRENCVEHEFKKEYDNAKALFSGKYMKDTKVDKKGILKAFKVKKGTYQDCPMQRPGA